MIDDSNYTHTENIVCPYCFKEETDSWEAVESDDRRQCGYCEKYFAYDSIISRTFSSHPIDCLNDETLHKWIDTPGRIDIPGHILKRCKKCDQRKKIEV